MVDLDPIFLDGFRPLGASKHLLGKVSGFAIEENSESIEGHLGILKVLLKGYVDRLIGPISGTVQMAG